MRRFGFNVIGHVSANVGVGVVARNAIRSLLEKGHPVATLDIDPGRGRTGSDTTYDYLAVPNFDDLPYGISIVVLSITALPDILIDQRIRLRDDVVTAGFFWWELPVIPPLWARSLEQFDVLVAGSEFLRSTFERHVSGIPAIHAVQSPAEIAGILPERKKFGIPDDKVVFVCIVEPTSDPIRKNPYAAIEAFQRAFKLADPAHLVIKLNNAQAAASESQLATLRETVGRLGSRVTLIEDFLPHRDVLQLYASCDVFVGLHRAEGLGLGLMEAMALGKPVVATGWSGNMTFMNHANSCLVGYRLIPVSGSILAYSPAFLKQEVRWADPDLDQASAWMTALVREPALRASIGQAAADDMRRLRLETARGVFADELRSIWGRAQLRPRRTAEETQSAIAMLRDLRFDHHATLTERVRSKSRAMLDRHLLWRFRSR
jgi:glycosyltransferase involved in cell wall biosynthesis